MGVTGFDDSTQDGITVAHNAAAYGHLTTLQWIVEREPSLLTTRAKVRPRCGDPSHGEQNGVTLAHMAAVNGHLATLQWIVGRDPSLLTDAAEVRGVVGWSIGH